MNLETIHKEGMRIMNDKVNEILGYFSKQISICGTKAKELELDHRSDEAVFFKIRMNVYDAFSAVFSAGQKMAGNDEQKLAGFFLSRLEQIPKNWQNALKAAQQHEEAEKAHIETIKLETAAEIEREFRRIWEVNA